MGYTHYWKKTKGMRAKAWTEAVAAVNLLIRANTVPIEVKEVDIRIPHEGKERKLLDKYRKSEPTFNWSADPDLQRANEAGWKAWREALTAKLPKVRYHKLHIEGVGEDAHETFVIPFRVSNVQDFDFTKTARKPYDKLVVACLCVMAESGLEVSSDGEPADWEEGRAWAEQVLGRPVKIPAGVTCKFCDSTGKFNREDLLRYDWDSLKGVKVGDPCPRCAELKKAA